MSVESCYLKFGNMSRIGKQPIEIPEKTTVTLSSGTATVKGPLGELSKHFRSDVEIAVKDKEIVLTPKKDNTLARALWGTYASHLRNMIKGVNEKFEKKLIIEGVGYKAEVSGNKLTLQVGFSHPVEKTVPEGVEATVQKNVISISGSDKEVVGQFAAEVRVVKKPEPYKGKGIRYDDEVVRRKQGKRAAAAA